MEQKTASRGSIRVLHIGNTAGVASVTAKFIDRLFGTRSEVMVRKELDKVGFTTYGKAYDDSVPRFFLRALSMSRGADLVHVYSWDRVLPWIKRLYSGKPAIQYYCGSEIRGQWKQKEPRWSKADAVAYTTSDLSEGAPPQAFQAFCPIDTDMFHPVALEKTPGSAVAVRYGMDSKVEEVAKNMGLKLTWVERGSVPYAKMPELLSKYEYYLDYRRPPEREAPVECLGKAGLEALACGCKAVDWSGKVYDSLPEENRPEVVAKKWYDVYNRLVA